MPDVLLYSISNKQILILSFRSASVAKHNIKDGVG